MHVHGSAGGGADVRGHADLDRHLPLCQQFHQLRVKLRGETVADALGTNVERGPDALRPGILSRVAGKAQAIGFGFGVQFFERLGAGNTLVRRRCRCRSGTDASG